MPTPRNNSLMRNLGAFVGNIWRGVATPATGAHKAEIRRDVEEETKETQDATLVVRRTTIEELEVKPKRNTN
jgi:hypothetical protein